MLSAGFAGFVTSTAINPVWLVKTRLQLHHGPLSIRQCIRKIYKNEGARGFYRVGFNLSLIYNTFFLGRNGIVHGHFGDNNSVRAL